MGREVMATIAAFSLTLSGCASYDGRGLQAGASPAQVRALMGEPAARMQEPTGGEIWAYPHGPLGQETFMARFAPSGPLSRVESVLDEDHFRLVQRGMEREEVRRIVGPPGHIEDFPRTSDLVWDYRYRDTWGYDCQFSVTFDSDRRVKSTLMWRERYNDND
jgi:outer membrane protein assembly factor BamE (lipoprotein component of BamABCDE complex)